MPKELPGQCKFLPSVKRAEGGAVGPSTTPSRGRLPPSQTPSFPAVLGSTEGTFSLDTEVCRPKRQDRQGPRGSAVGPGLMSLPVSPQDLDCFVIDNNGFILISERSQEVRCWGSEGRESCHPAAMSKGE